MKRTRRDVLVTVALDRATARLLDQLAATETESNRSSAIRKALREAAASRSFSPDDGSLSGADCQDPSGQDPAQNAGPAGG